ncbi:cortactin-binding protein 2-like [Sycon ciliatum]|uniref:cortactin-binding protein 2-like n=1 Tax=Sycon ciliatum TaxID=27933 RepID=UPI0031F6528B
MDPDRTVYGQLISPEAVVAEQSGSMAHSLTTKDDLSAQAALSSRGATPQRTELVTSAVVTQASLHPAQQAAQRHATASAGCVVSAVGSAAVQASSAISTTAIGDRSCPAVVLTDEQRKEAVRLQKLEQQLRDAHDLIALLRQQQEQQQKASEPDDTAQVSTEASAQERLVTLVEAQQALGRHRERIPQEGTRAGDSSSPLPARSADSPELANRNTPSPSGGPPPPPVARKPANFKLKKPGQASEDGASTLATSPSATVVTPTSPGRRDHLGRKLSLTDRPQSPAGNRPLPPPRRGSVLTPMQELSSASASGGGNSSSASPTSTQLQRVALSTPNLQTLDKPQSHAPSLQSPSATDTAVDVFAENDVFPAPDHNQSAKSRVSQEFSASTVLTVTVDDPGVARVRTPSRSSTSSAERATERYSGAMELAELELLCDDTVKSGRKTPPCDNMPAEQDGAPVEETRSAATPPPVAPRVRSSQPTAEPNGAVATSSLPASSSSHPSTPRSPGMRPQLSSHASVPVLQSPLVRNSSQLLRQNAIARSDRDLPAAIGSLSATNSNVHACFRASSPASSIESALRLAAEDGKLACVKLLLSQGADCNAVSTGNSSALHLASANGHKVCVQELLSHGAQPWMLDTQGLSAVQLSAKNGHAPCVETILQNTADTAERQQALKKALLLACLGSHKRCIEILQRVVNGDTSLEKLRHSKTTETDSASDLTLAQKSTVIVSPSSTDSALGAEDYSTGISPAHDRRQESIDECACELDVVLQFPYLNSGQGYGVQGDTSINLGTVTITRRTSWSRLETDVWKTLDRHLSAICKSVSQPLPTECLQHRAIPPASHLAVGTHDPVVKTATLKSITSWSSSITANSAGSCCNTSSGSNVVLPTAGQLKASTVYASDIGLGVDSVRMYSAGQDKKWRPDAQTLPSDEGINDAAGTSPYQLFGEEKSITVSLKGIGEGRLDQLSYQTLIPMNTLRSYLDKFRLQGKVLFSGPPACGKSEIATSLARCLLSALKAEKVKVDMLGCSLRGQHGEQDRILKMLHRTGMLVEEDYETCGDRSATSSSRQSPPPRHCILVVESSSAQSIQNGLGELLSCLHGDQTLWLNEGALPGGLYRLVGVLHLMVTLDTTGPIGLDPRSWHRFFHIRWRWDVEPLGGQLQRHLQRQLVIARAADVHAHTCSSDVAMITGSGAELPSGQEQCIAWINDVWQRINKLFTFLGYSQLVLGPNVFFSCPIQSSDPAAVASWLAELWNNQLAPCIEEAGGSHDQPSPSRQRCQLTSVKLLLVTIRLALLPTCPLQGNDLAQWLESLHCGMDNDEINEMVHEIRDNVISTSSDALSVEFDEDMTAPSTPQGRSMLPAQQHSSRTQRELHSTVREVQADTISEDIELAKIEANREQGTPTKDNNRPLTPSIFKRFQTLRNSARLSKRNSVAPETPTLQRPVKAKSEDKEFFAMITKMQGDRIDDQRVTAPACMFMQKPRHELDLAVGSSTSTKKTSGSTGSSSKAAKKSNKKSAANRQNNFENIFTLGRHGSKDRKQNDYENILEHGRQIQEPASRSASADFLNTADSEDNVFCSSTSASPDMTALHLPHGSNAVGPAAAGRGGSLRSSYVRRRSMSELMKLGSNKASDVDKAESSSQHKALGKMKSTQSVGRSSGGSAGEKRHHRSASNVFSLSTTGSTTREEGIGLPKRVITRQSPRKTLSANAIKPVEPTPGQITYM